MLRCKKPALWGSVAAVAIVAVISLFLLANKEMKAAPGSPSNQGAAYTTEYTSVKIKFLSDMGFKAASEYEISDPKTVAVIDAALNSAETETKTGDLNTNSVEQYGISLSKGIGGNHCTLYYDTLHDKAYIEKDGAFYEAETDFARYIDSFLENRNITFTIEADAAALFASYDWTLDYQINTLKIKLGSINDLAAFDLNAYYFAYSNVLSQDIGLDMSAYAGAAGIDIEIYRIHERMPQEFFPIQSCRGIVVRKSGKIIGAFISAGRHNTFSACSLKGNSFEKSAGQTFEEWLASRVNADNIEKPLSKLPPEQVIEEYFTALDKQDTKAAAYCVSRKTLLDGLSVNMLNEQLFNEDIGLPLAVYDLEGAPKSLVSAQVSDITLIDEPDESTKIFRVTVDLQYDGGKSDSGAGSWDCSMVYESPQTGWKIEGFGH